MSATACEVVLVTGGSKGIGRAVAERLAVAGGRLRHLVLTARGAGPLEEARAACEEAAQGAVEVHAIPCDIADPTAVSELFVEARRRCEFVDGLVLNAGIVETAKLHRTSDEMFERIFSINVMGVFRPMREALPDMLVKNRGRVVAVASIAAHAGMSYVSAYCASKHAVLGLVRSAAREYAAQGITVNAVCPGYVDTPMTQGSLAAIQGKTGLEPKEALARILATNPQGRLFQPEEVAAVIGWLMDEDAAGVNGASWTVDGGELAG